MKEQLGNIYHKLYHLLFGLLAFSIPLFDRIAAIAIILIMFTWVIEGKFIQKYQRIKEERYRQHILFFGLIYIIYIIGFFYSKNQYNALVDLQTKFSLLVFPILFATIDEKVLKDKKGKILNYYLVGSFVTTIILIIHSTYNYSNSLLTDEFFYHKLSWYQHAGYLSMFLVFAIGIICYNLSTAYQNYSNQQRFILFFLIVYFSIFIIMLISKAGIISLALLLVATIGYIFYQKKYLKGILFLIVTVICLWAAIKLVPNVAFRFNRAQNAVSDESLDKDTRNSTTERILIWQSSLQIIKENFLIGVGTGDVKDLLVHEYEKKEIASAYEQKLNAHNQYLQTFIAVGFIGFLILILTLLLPLLYSVKKRQVIYFIFILLFGFNLLIESMLERQAGVVFYAFFSGLLFFYMFTENQKDKSVSTTFLTKNDR